MAKIKGRRKTEGRKRVEEKDDEEKLVSVQIFCETEAALSRTR